MCLIILGNYALKGYNFAKFSQEKFQKKFHKKTPVTESLFSKVALFSKRYQKRDSGTGFFL